MAQDQSISEEQAIATVKEIYRTAHQLYRNGCFADAESLFRLLTTCDPKNLAFWMGLGASLQMQKKYKDAVDTYGAAALLDEEELDPYSHFHAAECLFALQENKRALIALASAKTVASKSKSHAALLKQIALFQECWSLKS